MNAIKEVTGMNKKEVVIRHPSGKRRISAFIALLLVVQMIAMLAPGVASASTTMSQQTLDAAVARALLLKDNNYQNITKFKTLPQSELNKGEGNKTIAEYYHGWCALFVDDVFQSIGINAPSGNASTIRERYRNAGALHTDLNAPKGAAVFFYYWGGGVEYGHIGISLGDGTCVNALSQISVTGLTALSNCEYVGWACWGADIGYRMPQESSTPPPPPVVEGTYEVWKVTYPGGLWLRSVPTTSSGSSYFIMPTGTTLYITDKTTANGYTWGKVIYNSFNSAQTGWCAIDYAAYQNTVNPPPADIKVTSLGLDRHTLSMKAGDATGLSATLQPSNATNKAITWRSDSSSVASVDAQGTVTANAPGTATITATSADGPSDRCTVTVESTVHEALVEIIPPSNAIFDEQTGEYQIVKGRSQRFSYRLPPELEGGRIKWTTSNKRVATIARNGKCKPRRMGVTTISLIVSKNGIPTYAKPITLRVVKRIDLWER
ncbi:MAG: Ig-like domain-containing protein [Clostridia bacterium]